MSAPKKCIRNLLGEGHKATEIIKLSVGDGTYELDLCSKHADQFNDELWGWLRLARDVTEVSQFDGASLSERLKHATVIPEGLPEKFLPAPEPVVSKTEMDIIRLRWSLSEHARERILERGPMYGYGLDDVLLAAEKPERATRDKEGRVGAWVHWRGPVKVVVNRSTRTVITVGGKEEIRESA